MSEEQSGGLPTSLGARIRVLGLFREGRWVWAVPALLALLVCVPLIAHPYAIASLDSFRTHDWLESAKFDAFARVALLEWHTLPHWNPYLQGGMPQLSHPSDGSLSPLLLFTLLFGETLGMKLSAISCLMLGAAGMALLGRDRLGLSAQLSCFCGAAYAVAGWFPSRVSVGFYETTLYTVFPLLVWTFLTSEGRPRRLFAATFMLAVCSLQFQLGLPILLLGLGLLVLLDCLRGLLPWGALGRLAGMCVAAAGLSAAKHLPVLLWLSETNFRQVETYPMDFDSWYGSLGELLQGLVFVVPFPGTYDVNGYGVSAEFGFIGLAPLLLLLILGGIATLRQASPAIQNLSVVGFIFLWLGFGPHAPVDLFRPLWEVPIFHSMRGPVRYTNYWLLLVGCVLAAQGMNALIRAGAPTRALAGLAAAALLWPAAQSWSRNQTSFTHDIPPSVSLNLPFVQEEVRGTGFGQSRGGDHRFNAGNTLLYANLKAGVGTVYEPEDLVGIDIRALGYRRYDPDQQSYFRVENYMGEVYCTTHDCSPEILEVGPNHFLIQVDLEKPDILVLNQNWNRFWTASRGEVGPVHGVVGTQLSMTGPVQVEFRYRSTPFSRGLLMSFVTLLGCVALLARREGWMLASHASTEEAEESKSDPDPVSSGEPT